MKEKIRMENQQNNQKNELQKEKAGEKKLTLKTDTSRIIKTTTLILALTLGVFILWAAFAPLNQGAAAGGFVTVANYRKVVQHQYGGTIKEILVKEGEEVKKGQVLIKLEDSEIRARYAQIKGEYITALAVQSRLKAERAFMSRIFYPSEVLEMKEETEIKRVIQAQEELFRARKAKLEADKKIIMESINGLKQYVQQLKSQKLSYENQLQIVKSQMQSLRGLAEEGYYPKNRFLDLERLSEELRGRIAEISANQLRAETSIQEYMMRLSALERDYLREVEAELADIEKRLPGLRDSFNAAKDVLAKTEIKAPEDGVVMGLRFHTIGGVIQPGHPILEIVPKNSELIVEAKVLPTDIEDIRPGQMADLHFIALDPKKTPVLEGQVVYVSPDIQFDEASKIPYYLVRIKISEDTFEKIKKLNKEINPGMPVQVVIKTGSRTFLSYLLKPFIDRLAISFLK